MYALLHLHVRRLEIFVGFASFTSCLVAVDKLYLYYATVCHRTWRMARAVPVARSSHHPRPGALSSWDLAAADTHCC